MSKRMITIKVKKEHISAGEPCSDCGCPIALAVLDKLKLQSRVSVNGTDIHIGRFDADQQLQDPYAIKIPIDNKIREFIQSFDMYERVRPIKLRFKLKKKLAKTHFLSSAIE